MGPLSAPVSGAVMDFNPYETRTEADPTHQFGAVVVTNHGRDAYRHGMVGASNVSRGKLQQAPAPKANHMNRPIIDDVAIGGLSVTIDLAATAADASEYDEGYLAVVDGTGEGQTLGVSHNPAAVSDANVVVKLANPVKIALDNADTEVTLIHNPYRAFVEAAVQTRTPSGVALIALLAGDYGWLKSRGVVSVLGGSAVTLGGILGSDASTAGAVTDATDQTGVDTVVRVGEASIVAGATGEYHPIVVQVDK